ncbi:MAG: DUF2188 domain-containing protein [Methanobacterium paludis]|nr:DUF2188 domain-containing protein [Methanobacterium paludis]
MANKPIHIVSNQKNGWDTKKEGAKRASKHFKTKAEAQKAANEQGRREKVEVIPHKKNGKFQKDGRSSYGNDPSSSKG